MTNTLLICPDCKDEGVNNVLGSVDASGIFSIVRFRRGEGTLITYIKADNYQVVCTCGFGTVVTAHPHGRISFTRN